MRVFVWIAITSSAIASATLEPQSSVACMLPSIQTAGRISAGLRPMVTRGMSRPSALLPSEETRTSSGYASAQASSCRVSSA